MKDKPIMTIDEYGTKFWKLNGKLHNDDGPAIIYRNGDKSYWVNGKLHNENGPAIIWSNGDKEYRVNDKRHREDGPAVIWSNGYKEYYVNGKLHNEYGPAVIWSNGTKEYYLNDCKTTEYVVMNKTYETFETAHFPGLFYIDEDGTRMVTIGCEDHSLDWWIKNVHHMGREHGYSDDETFQVETLLHQFNERDE